MKLPTRRALKSFKEPASHEDVYTLVCGGIDALANDRKIPVERLRAELRFLKEKCSRHLTSFLAEAVTGKEFPHRGLRIHDKKRRPKATPTARPTPQARSKTSRPRRAQLPRPAVAT